MMNFFKYSILMSAVMALSGSVYAESTINLEDGGTIYGSADFASSASGIVSETINSDGWSVSAIGNYGGTAQFPSLSLQINATFNGNDNHDDELFIWFGSDGFGPASSTSFSSKLTGSAASYSRALAMAYNTWYVAGSAVPTVANPWPGGDVLLSSTNSLQATPASGGEGSYGSLSEGGPISLSNYSLGEEIILTGLPDGGSSQYSLTATLTAVPEPSVVTLAVVAAGAFGMMRRLPKSKLPRYHSNTN